MQYHRLVVSYKGTHYFGWQDLGEGENKPTVQRTIHQVLKKICKQRSCSLAAASRTDGGVHAQGQVVKVSLDLEIDSEKLLRGMNSLLPQDIRVMRCEPCPQEFNPNRDSASKEYHYYFSTDAIHNPLLSDFVTQLRPANAGTIAESIDIVLMQQGCELFVGEHDFQNFAKYEVNIGSTRRTVFSCDIQRASFSTFGDNVYCLRIVGDGFLRNMVRYMAGTLFALGRKQLSANSISEALSCSKAEKLSAKAKARGLHLISINY